MRDTSSNRQMIGTLIFILIGPILWALQLTLIYGAQSSLCAFEVGIGANGGNVLAAGTVIGASVLCMALAVAAFVMPGASYRLITGASSPDDQWPFLTSVMRILAGLSLLAMLYAALGAVLLPACAQLR
ncbi:hypothetical protein [Devosia nitrariae]|uniref:Uncharacterized protein n=1 Tax=Devosia nitrariae TaxID=2071872 RepID=A0ABQ5W6C4_9HYPH|nr:hypothetical protein [Devosia nitrariae]GLQ55343.1 hypothetical protein GCM10010862_26020 [Devosia nitrariae]